MKQGELFNLREDLAEQHNRVQDEPERAQRMLTLLNKIVTPN